MGDDARIARLTALARTLWCNAQVSKRGDAVLVDADHEPRFPLQVHHPRALDALEAALIVLTGAAELPTVPPAPRRQSPEE